MRDLAEVLLLLLIIAVQGAMLFELIALRHIVAELGAAIAEQRRED